MDKLKGVTDPIQIAKILAGFTEEVVSEAKAKSTRKRSKRRSRKKGELSWKTHPELQVPNDPVWNEPFPKFLTEEEREAYIEPDDGNWAVMKCPQCDCWHNEWESLYIAGKRVRCRKCGYTSGWKKSICSYGCLAPEDAVAVEIDDESGKVTFEATGAGSCDLRHPPIGLGVHYHWYREHPADGMRNNIIPECLPLPVYGNKVPKYLQVKIGVEGK